jgi:hypothetical protein
VGGSSGISKRGGLPVVCIGQRGQASSAEDAALFSVHLSTSRTKGAKNWHESGIRTKSEYCILKGN